MCGDSIRLGAVERRVLHYLANGFGMCEIASIMLVSQARVLAYVGIIRRKASRCTSYAGSRGGRTSHVIKYLDDVRPFLANPAGYAEVAGLKLEDSKKQFRNMYRRGLIYSTLIGDVCYWRRTVG